MVSERNRILDIVEYIESCGIEVNLKKNKARGNKGFFSAKGVDFRIDIAKGQSDANTLSILAHEFAHFLHYRYDNTLKSLEFVFSQFDEIIEEELLKITVEAIPASMAKSLFEQKETLKTEIAELSKELTKSNRLSLSKAEQATFEKQIKYSPLKYLLKHDKVKVIDGFKESFYSIDSLERNSEMNLYIILNSKKRALQRINTRINRLNKYYNSPTELFARAFELLITNEEKLLSLAPNVHKAFMYLLEQDSIPLMTNFYKKTL